MRYQAIELARKATTKLDACHNFVSASNRLSDYVAACMDASPHGLHLEGYPGVRFHEGADLIDELETHAEDLAKDIYSVPFASVQPWRCTNAILATAHGLTGLGSAILGLDCSSGGYFATGASKAHLLSSLYNVQTYTVDPTNHLLDYDQIRKKAREAKPAIIFAGDTSYSRTWDWPQMRSIADEVGAYLVADVSQIAGLIAGRVLGNPAPLADVTIFATYKTLRGPRGALVLANDASVFSKIRRAIYPGLQSAVDPRLVAGIAAALEEARSPEFPVYARQIVLNAQQLCAEIQEAGLGVVGGGTDNHSFTISLSEDESTDAATVCHYLAKRGILTNKTPVPFDTRPISKCSGIRIGTPFETSRDITSDELTVVAAQVKAACLDPAVA
ncbi:DegT/DnrJ/EryC1/StrS family aminotransferase [Halomonas caseinilytica]|uniref:DegT/DnrJ/EryC1/StrS family aminotransferase n=1 Tax=Halomonas caseinilytica TaxID=438744 RepID=UPI0007E572D9|nr:DegT/DnrJ/EryC1/StrS family aminotransferase [Halomonas caseinilytica]SEN40153.1 glycine hydroxymethyltransferase [Halomonas caseinilytica]